MIDFPSLENTTMDLDFITILYFQMVKKALVLNAISVMLIILKNRLIEEMPSNPQSYQHGYDFYRHCLKFRQLLSTVMSFLSLENMIMHPDVHLLVNRFVEDLSSISDDVTDLSVEADYSPESQKLIFFDLYLKRRLRHLFTTLCPVGKCNKCGHW